jgi:hypothetical protein
VGGITGFMAGVLAKRRMGGLLSGIDVKLNFHTLCVKEFLCLLEKYIIIAGSAKQVIKVSYFSKLGYFALMIALCSLIRKLSAMHGVNC